MTRKRVIAVVIFITLFSWFLFEVVFNGNLFTYQFLFGTNENISPQQSMVQDNIRAISHFFAYLSFSFLPFILKSDGIFRFLKYFVILLPATILIFIVGPSDAMFAPDERDVAIGLALLHIPVSLFAMFREHRSEKLTDK
tara:strand:- start:380 stop:799 length:420 start_codon:yes stop_codon:yes gene_type:complete